MTSFYANSTVLVEPVGPPASVGERFTGSTRAGLRQFTESPLRNGHVYSGHSVVRYYAAHKNKKPREIWGNCSNAFFIFYNCFSRERSLSRRGVQKRDSGQHVLYVDNRRGGG
jgi:hypothetical protein